MLGLEKPYYGEDVGIATQKARPISMREQLNQNIAHHERELTRTKELLKLLDENPAIEKFMDLSRS